MGKSMVIKMYVELVEPRGTVLERAIELKLVDGTGFDSFVIGDVPNHPSYLPTAYDKLKELLAYTRLGWVGPERKYPRNGVFGLKVPFAVWYEKRDRSIHLTAPPAPKLHLRLVDGVGPATQSRLYRVLFDILEIHGKIPASVSA